MKATSSGWTGATKKKAKKTPSRVIKLSTITSDEELNAALLAASQELLIEEMELEAQEVSQRKNWWLRFLDWATL